MRMNVSTTTVVGGLTKDVEVREVNRGGKTNKVANFTIAVSRPYKDADGNYGSDFYDCEYWGPGADYMAKGKKGQAATATGRMEQRTYTDKEGKRRTTWTLKATAAGLGDEPGSAGGEVMAEDDDADFPPF